MVGTAPIESLATSPLAGVGRVESLIAADSAATESVAGSIAHAAQPGAQQDANGNWDSPGPPTEEERVPAYKRPGVLLIGAAIVIAVLVAAAIWWKIRKVQPDGAMSRADRSMLNAPEATAATGQSHLSAPPYLRLRRRAATQNRPSNAIGSGDDISDPAPQNASSANPQELSKFPRVTESVTGLLPTQARLFWICRIRCNMKRTA